MRTKDVEQYYRSLNDSTVTVIMSPFVITGGEKPETSENRGQPPGLVAGKWN